MKTGTREQWLAARQDLLHREKELTPEGLPGHHQPQKHKKKKRR